MTLALQIMTTVLPYIPWYPPVLRSRPVCLLVPDEGTENADKGYFGVHLQAPVLSFR